MNSIICLTWNSSKLGTAAWTDLQAIFENDLHFPEKFLQHVKFSVTLYRNIYYIFNCPVVIDHIYINLYYTYFQFSTSYQHGQYIITMYGLEKW